VRSLSLEGPRRLFLISFSFPLSSDAAVVNVRAPGIWICIIEHSNDRRREGDGRDRHGIAGIRAAITYARNGFVNDNDRSEGTDGRGAESN